MGTRLYIFDADDTLRHTRVPGQPCPYRSGEWELLPRVRERLREIPFGPEGPWLGIASNQDRVGYGHLTAETALCLLEELVREATEGRVTDARIEMCPHTREEQCPCRKPSPLMLQRIASRFGVPADEALFVGDTEDDRRAAESAGMGFAWPWDFFGLPSRLPTPRVNRWPVLTRRRAVPR